MRRLILILIIATIMIGAVLVALTSDVQSAQAETESSLVWPISGTAVSDTDAISSPFGPRWQASQNRYDYHSGIDIAQPLGTPVHAIADGVVHSVGWLSDVAGLSVILYHPELDVYSAYLHLSSATVISPSQVITQSQIIGEVGDSGTTTFMHLHFEVRLTTTNYPYSTRNPLRYLPHADVAAPTIQITQITSDPIYSPTVSLFITTARAELDLNQIHVTLEDYNTGALVDDQLVDFNQRTHTGGDTLDQDGIQLIPAHFNTSTNEYEIVANFYDLHGLDSFTLTAKTVDLAGNVETAVFTAIDTTPPAQVTDLTATVHSTDCVTLRWTAPGDSDYVGQATAYDIRYANEPLNNFTWTTAVSITTPSPIVGGQIQTMTITGPFTEPTYFTIRATDSEGQQSLLSNAALATRFVYLPVITK